MKPDELKKEAEKYAEQCYGWTNNDLALDVAKATYIASAEPREKRIAELEKENAELKVLLDCKNCSELLEEECEVCAEASHFKCKGRAHLTKAKDLIKNIIRVTWGEGWNYSLDWKVQAEQFLRETDVDNAIQKANKGLDLDRITKEVEDDLKEGCPDVLCEDCTKECEMKKIMKQANEGLDFNKIADEVEQDIKEQKE